MLKINPWYHFSGNKKRYYSELGILEQKGFIISEEDTNGILSFTGDLEYKEYVVTCNIIFKATYPYHAPIVKLNKINGLEFPSYFPQTWRHLSAYGTICLFENKRDKWSTELTSLDIIERINTWLKCNVDGTWDGLEIQGPDPIFSNPSFYYGG